MNKIFFILLFVLVAITGYFGGELLIRHTPGISWHHTAFPIVLVLIICVVVGFTEEEDKDHPQHRRPFLTR